MKKKYFSNNLFSKAIDKKALAQALADPKKAATIQKILKKVRY